MSLPPLTIRRPLHVAVLLGGPSAEREISLESGNAVMAALERCGHRVTAIDPGRNAIDAAEFQRLADWRSFDVAFLALHGTFGEDGTIQSYLDAIGLPYTGSDAKVSRLAFSKSATKERLIAEGIPTAEYMLVNAFDLRSRIATHAASLGYPLVIKPDAQGSSLGVSVVRAPEELEQALEACFAFGPYGVMERYIDGAEWTVGFLGSHSLPPLCISTTRAFFDFHAKYRDEATRFHFENEGSQQAQEALTAVASRTISAMGISGTSRVDIRLDRDQKPWVLEANTLPGFTSHSAVPAAAARIGITFESLCERVIGLALSQQTLRRVA